jgi:hypothetical protein
LAAFVKMTKQRAGAMMVIADSFFVLRRQRIAELALGARLPTIFPNRDSVEAGGLMSYGDSLAEFFRGAATYVNRILKGAKPAELPVEQPTKFLLVVNLKTAKALGLELPAKVLFVRKGGAAARMMLVQAAANEWKVPAAECTAANGVITHKPSNRSTTYGKVADAAGRVEPPTEIKLKDPKDWKIIGKGVKRLDSIMTGIIGNQTRIHRGSALRFDAAFEAKDRRGVVLDNLHQDHLSVAGHTTHRTHSETSSARPIGKLARFDQRAWRFRVHSSSGRRAKARNLPLASAAVLLRHDIEIRGR